MKSLTVFLFAIAIIILGCQKEEALETLPLEDQLVFQNMEEAFQWANNYNDSLKYCHTNSDILCTHDYVQYCDSLFHHFGEMWEHHHDGYHHDNGHCDHEHDDMGMHHHNNDQHAHQDDHSHGHQEGDHDRMDELMHDHEQYHP